MPDMPLYKRSALFSPDKAYRYSLSITWDGSKERLGFLMLNPSTATEMENDPTVERCERRAVALGFGSIQVANLFAFRSTDPKGLGRTPDPVGPYNNQAIINMARNSGKIVLAWGNDGSLLGRARVVERLLEPFKHRLVTLGLTAAGEPTHPLYIAFDKPLLPYARPEAHVLG